MKSKQEYQALLLGIIDLLKAHYSAGCAGLELGAFAAGYGNEIAKMEGFSRVLWGLASYWAGGGEDESFLAIYQKGLANGTDPHSPEYWGDLHDKDQRMVEMAAVSYGILMTPEKLWEPLAAQEKDQLAAWLYQINLYTQAENNWQFFKVMVNLALKRVGRQWCPEQVKDAMAKYESFYLGNGWYSDGKRPQKDYYTSFGIHFYCLLYVRFMSDEEPEICARFRERAGVFAKTFIYWFDDEGKALPFGRSLTYRFAQAAFFSACAMADVECFSWGIIKGLLERHMEYWMKQPIFDCGGVLTVGYNYPNLLISEGYNSPDSPYWALKFFVFLALPDDHPIWQAESEPLPELAEICAVPECDMLISHRRHEVAALTAGQYSVMEYPHVAEKYSKFAYSSRFGFCVPRSYHQLEQAGTDSMLAFHVHEMYYVRSRCLEYSVTSQAVYSKWSPVAGIEVETWIEPVAGGHRRRHQITSSLACVCTAYDCGFSYPDCLDQTRRETEDGQAIVSDDNGYSKVTSECGEGVVIAALPNMNLIFPLVDIPAVKVVIEPGVTVIETLIETAFFNHDILIGGGNCYALRD